jgi:hypothetical protein
MSGSMMRAMRGKTTKKKVAFPIWQNKVLHTA